MTPHRPDFTLEDLAGDYRPLVHGEKPEYGDERFNLGWQTIYATPDSYRVNELSLKHRTRRELLTFLL